MNAMELIEAERKRQESKGYDAAHDDTHTDASLAACAATVLARYAGGTATFFSNSQRWPYESANHIQQKWMGQSVRLLTITAALIVAEIERLQRAQSRPVDPEPADESELNVAAAEQAG